MLKLLRNSQGAAIIEAALVLPVLILVVMGGIEIGVYFIKQRIVARAVDSVIIPLQLNPSDEDREIEKQIRNSGMGAFDFSIGNVDGNYVCTRAYSSFEEARSKLCTVTSTSDHGWHPEAKFWMLNPTKPYYVAIVAHARYKSIIGSKSFLPDINEWHVFQVTPSALPAAITNILTPSVKTSTEEPSQNPASNTNNQKTIEDSARQFKEILSNLPSLKQ